MIEGTSGGVKWYLVVKWCPDSSFLDTKQWDFQTLLQIRLTPTVQLKETANFRILDKTLTKVATFLV